MQGQAIRRTKVVHKPVYRRPRLVLGELDGHAEVMFSPTPLGPSSPPRIPPAIKSLKRLGRSLSSPAIGKENKHAVRRVQSDAWKRSPGKMSAEECALSLVGLARAESFVCQKRT